MNIQTARKADTEAEDRQWEEVTIEMPWGHVCGKWYGDRDVQPVLGLHGWQDNAGTFDRLMPLLPKNIAVFNIDLPGHGRSSHFPIGKHYYLFWDYVCVVRQIVKHFGWHNIKLLGHSMGAGVSIERQEQLKSIRLYYNAN